MDNDTPVSLYITAPNREEAISLCRNLLSERLVACTTILEHATSLYWWQGEIEQHSEVVIIAKTMAHHVEAATAKVKATHSYSCPCVTSSPIEGGNEEYLAWIGQETHKN